jgi:hypothetical protein
MKNKSVLVATIIIFLISVVLTTALINSQAEENKREELVTDLDMLIKSYKIGDVDVIDISTITPFEWERLYLFAPYTSKERIVEVTGIKWSGNQKTFIESNDGIVLFIFVNEDKVVQYIDYHRDPDFLLSVRETGYSPSEAIFVLDQKGRVVPNSP